MQARLNAGMNRPLDSLAQRVRHARTMRKLSQQKLAQRSGMKQPDISKIELGLIQSTTGIARIAEALGVPPRWLESGDVGDKGSDYLLTVDGVPLVVVEIKEPSRGYRGVDHDVSYASPTVTPTTMEWGDLMKELPLTFQLLVRDDAMAPFLNVGDTARFSRDKPPSPGRRVLIRDGDGHHYIREYRARRGDHWQAIALNSSYDLLDSIADDLTVVAVLTGADWQ